MINNRTITTVIQLNWKSSSKISILDILLDENWMSKVFTHFFSRKFYKYLLKWVRCFKITWLPLI